MTSINTPNRYIEPHHTFSIFFFYENKLPLLFDRLFVHNKYNNWENAINKT